MSTRTANIRESLVYLEQFAKRAFCDCLESQGHPLNEVNYELAKEILFDWIKYELEELANSSPEEEEGPYPLITAMHQAGICAAQDYLKANK